MKYIEIKDAFSIKKGKKVEQVESKNDHTVRYIQIGDLRNSREVKYCNKEENYVYVDSNDIVIAWDGANAGTVGYGLDGAIGSTLAKLEVKTEDIFVPFVALYLQTKFNYFQSTATGATIPHISRKALESLQIPLLSLEKQKNIFNLLKQTQNIIEKRQTQIAVLDELTQSVFLKMFGNPIDNPNNLERERLGELIDVVGGYAFKSKDFIDEGVPVIKIGTANKGYFDLNTIAFLPQDYGDKYEKYIVTSGDLLITLTGTVGKDDYANICEVTDDYSRYLLNQRVARLKIKSISLNKHYLFYCFKQKKFKEQLTSMSRGVRQANISNDDIKNLLIPLPSLKTQEKFADIVLKIELQKKKFVRSLNNLELLYNSLLQKAFKGELFEA